MPHSKDTTPVDYTLRTFNSSICLFAMPTVYGTCLSVESVEDDQAAVIVSDPDDAAALGRAICQWAADEWERRETHKAARHTASAAGCLYQTPAAETPRPSILARLRAFFAGLFAGGAA